MKELAPFAVLAALLVRKRSAQVSLAIRVLNSPEGNLELVPGHIRRSRKGKAAVHARMVAVLVLATSDGIKSPLDESVLVSRIGQKFFTVA